MKRQPRPNTSIKWPYDLWCKVVDILEDDNTPYTNFSETVHDLTGLGIQARALKQKIKDPELLEKIAKSYRGKGMSKLVEALSSDEISALSMALQVEEAKRFEQRALI